MCQLCAHCAPTLRAPQNRTSIIVRRSTTHHCTTRKAQPLISTDTKNKSYATACKPGLVLAHGQTQSVAPKPSAVLARVRLPQPLLATASVGCPFSMSTGAIAMVPGAGHAAAAALADGKASLHKHTLYQILTTLILLVIGLCIYGEALHGSQRRLLHSSPEQSQE